MALDEALAVSVRAGNSPPVLRVYEWSAPSLSLGSFQKTSSLNLEFCRAMNIDVVRRLTGGRAVLHWDELTYSFSAGYDYHSWSGLKDSLISIGTAFRVCFEQLGIACQIKEYQKRESGFNTSPLCFESTSFGEISHSGLKIVGSAQKRWSNAFMQHGSIPFSIDFDRLSGIFYNTPKANKRRLEPGLLRGLRDLLPAINTEQFKRCLVSSFEKTFAVSLLHSVPSAEELRIAGHMAAKQYLDQNWTLGKRADSRSGNNTERATQR
jgi:lipoyl(octanoyl) transferase